MEPHGKLYLIGFIIMATLGTELTFLALSLHRFHPLRFFTKAQLLTSMGFIFMDYILNFIKDSLIALLLIVLVHIFVLSDDMRLCFQGHLDCLNRVLIVQMISRIFLLLQRDK